jgi:phosphomevalonate kinase
MGEYAVLDGAPALVAAVDRGVACTVSPQGQLEVRTPGDDRFVRAALQAVGAPAARYSFEDWNPTSLPSKPGLGGSAAATVAACLAGALAKGERPPTHQRHAKAAAVHHAVQGSGSGVDIAASVYGGIQRFERGQADHQPSVEPVVVWSGQSASTGPRVHQYRAWSATQRAAFCSQSTALVDGWQADPIAALEANRHLLAAMAHAAGISWATPALDWLAATAMDCGGAAKPSGAGGGDIAVALFRDDDAQGAFLRRVADRGLVHIPVSLAGPAHAIGYQAT